MSKQLSIRAIRRLLRWAYGKRQYRITTTGDIHIYGQMTNSGFCGWYLWGHLNDPDTQRRLAEIAPDELVA